MVDTLGDDGVAVVVLRPRHWLALHTAILPWLEELAPSVATTLEPVRNPTTWPGPLALGLGLAPGSITLEGWDVRRSIVASLGEVPYAGPPGVVTPQLAPFDELPPVRHQLWIPATDATTLIASLRTTLERMGNPFPALVQGREGAHAITIDDVTIALLPARDAVHVMVFHGAVGGDENARLEHLRARLDRAARPPRSTTPFALLTQPDAFASGWLRPWRLRPLAAWSGAVQIARVLPDVVDDQRAFVLARGVQILLATELLMSDEGAELDDTAMSLVADEGVLRLRTATTLSPEGAAIMQAASAGAGETYPAASGDAWIDVALRLDARAMLDATTPPPALAAATTPTQLAQAVSEGGVFASLYMGSRHPFGMLRVVEQGAKTERLPLPIDVLPIAAQVIWRGQHDDVPRVAVSLQWPKSYVDRPLAGMVPIAKAEPGFESLRMDTLSPNGRPVTVFGLGGEAASAFDTSASNGFAGVLYARASLTRIGADVAKQDPERGAMLKSSGDVQLTVEHHPGMLVSELAWAPGGGSVEPRAMPELGGKVGTAPAGSTVSDGTRCLAQAGRGVVLGLGALARVDETMLGTVATKALLEVETQLRCAGEDPVTAEAAMGLRRLLLQAASDAMTARGQAAAAKSLLDTQCKTSKDAVICGRAER